MTHCKKLTKKTREQLSSLMDLQRSKGLKALSREQRQRLEAYQHLFYLLQVSTARTPPPQLPQRRVTQVCCAPPRPSPSTWPS